MSEQETAWLPFEPGWSTPPMPPPPPMSPPAAPPGWGPRATLAVAMVAALIGAGVGALVARTSSGGGGQTVVEKFSGNTSVLNTRPGDIQAILAKVLPAVVTIKSTVVIQSPANGGFFGFGGGGGTQTSLDEGTGMIITADGEIVTNNHVVSGASSITVNLNGSDKDLAAKVIGTDPSDDVALIQVSGESGLPTVSFGRSADVKVGDGVVAIGNALGLSGGPTVTAGIISAEGRGLTIQDPNSGATITLANLLQTDAAINPGNSGGPLVNSRGQVIGMNSDEAVNAGSAQAQNIGFAIPADTITHLVPLLRKGGTITLPRAYLGIQGGDETPQQQQEYGLTPSTGALVETVGPNTPAAKAGIQPGDVIVSLDGTGVAAWDDLTQDLRGYNPGQTVTLGVYRGTRLLNISVTLGTAPSGSQ
ncbi:MAG TPA: trypsin-like peptidase domain-containing protein [Acidimicrobiales bacterium]|nr:trypsin-like peptidase domain-containing protein [Acidimicrobiales bacterium]